MEIKHIKIWGVLSLMAVAILFLASSVFSQLAHIPQNEREALIAFYNSTNGDKLA